MGTLENPCSTPVKLKTKVSLRHILCNGTFPGKTLFHLGKGINVKVSFFRLQSKCEVRSNLA
jgi:hypothetical protein